VYAVHGLGDTLAALAAALVREAAHQPLDFKVLVFLPTARQTQFFAAVLRDGMGSGQVCARLRILFEGTSKRTLSPDRRVRLSALCGVAATTQEGRECTFMVFI
jgi:hypothetical protein